MTCPTALAEDTQTIIEPLWLKEIRLRAARRVRWLRHLWTSHRYEGEHLLAISHSEVDRALLPWGELRAAEHGFYRDDPQAAELSEAIHSLNSAPPDPRWERLTTTLQLTAPEAHLAALGLAAAVDPALRRVFGYLLDLQEPAGPTPGLAAQLFDHPPFWFPAPDSNLVRWHVARPLDDGRDPYTTSTSWDADALLLPGLLTEPPAGWAGGTTGRCIAAPHPPLLRPDVCDAIVDFAGALAGRPIEIELVGPPGSGRTCLAATVASRLGLGLISVDARTPAGAADPSAPAVREVRRAILEGCAVEWQYAEALPAAALAALPLSPLTFLSTDEPLPSPSTAIRRSFRLQPITRVERVELWSSLSEEPAPPPITEWTLRPAEVAVASQVTPAGENAVTDVCRRLLLAGTPELLTHLPLPHSWDDLVVSRRTYLHLQEVDQQARNRGEVLDEWGLRRLTSMGSGLTALFAGPSGTGKTMAAQVLARSLGLDLYRVDLAGMVSKYIGETEKHLKVVFDACERAPVLLLFDEADALFGKRTEVKDAHDRYANIEVDYVLQRMEAFNGVAVLSTNRKGDLDSAFVRRIAFIVDFAAPDADERERLWRLALEGTEVLGTVDWRALAHEFDLTGAGIKSAALAAAFLARTDASPIEMRHILAATRRELEKQGEIMRPGRRVAS
ncbi:AAA family ATPase [Mycolicibacterium sp. lyk4-40-TYG-92]|uniref:AAA family ATPase n=1 Tax=Mycolicibacterium sp. lyk4-40-TYG-92 TaxID=3040295 RepID=UPI00254A74A9|nr:AAA family ATPase [Mycolicibacterium sp. lyk4-40-TYG-92]